MYWIDWLDQTGSAVIEKASMDGQNRQTVINSSLSRPYDLTLDLATDTLYFIDGYLDVISAVNTDGSNRRRLHLFLSNVVPFSLAFHGNTLFWSERRMRVISRMGVEGEGGGSEGVRVGNVTVLDVRPAGLVVVAMDVQPQGQFLFITFYYYYYM